MTETRGINAVPDELAGKAKRVIGFFSFMAGSGIVLDSTALWLGGLLMLIGAVVFIWGVVEAGSRSALRLGAREDAPSAPMAPPTGSNL